MKSKVGRRSVQSFDAKCFRCSELEELPSIETLVYLEELWEKWMYQAEERAYLDWHSKAPDPKCCWVL